MPCWTEHPWPGAGCNATVWPRAMQELGRHRGTGRREKCERLLVVWLLCRLGARMSSKRALLPRRLAGRPDVCNPAVHHRAFRPPRRVQCADGLGLAWDVNCFAESRRLRLRQPRTPPSGARDLSLRPARGTAHNIISQPHYARRRIGRLAAVLAAWRAGLAALIQPSPTPTGAAIDRRHKKEDCGP